ncbi:MAG: hypothetical protein ABEH43_03050 [Flavobacteriales bacterium]
MGHLTFFQTPSHKGKRRGPSLRALTWSLLLIIPICFWSCEQKVRLSDEQRRFLENAEETISYFEKKSGDTVKLEKSGSEPNFSWETVGSGFKKVEKGDFDYINQTNDKDGVGFFLYAEEKKDAQFSIDAFSYSSPDSNFGWKSDAQIDDITVNGDQYHNVRRYEGTRDSGDVRFWIDIDHGLLKVKDPSSGKVYERIDL